MDHYKSALWLEFRKEVIQLDGGICVRCLRGAEDGVVLNVHHKQYLLGHKPWEYPHHLCETLCCGCHAAEHGKIPPRFGWVHMGYEDLGEPLSTCDLCGTSIRHVFFVQHEKWIAMQVGEICCDHLTDTQVASDHMDSVHRYTDRRKRYVDSPRWKIDKFGNNCIRQKGINLSILRSENSFKLKVNEIIGKLVFRSELEVKIKAFDLMESGAIDTYLNKKKEIFPTKEV